MKSIFSLLPIFLLLPFSACAASNEATPPVGSAALTLISPAFKQSELIPQKFTCHGQEISPAMEWSTPPEGTKSLALIMDDPDAPMGTWVHWLVYNLPPDARSLPEGASSPNAASNNLPQGAVQGKTSFNRSDYGGPCPPSGQHRYFFRIYALDTLLNGKNMDKAALIQSMNGHVLAQGELMGIYKQ